MPWWAWALYGVLAGLALIGLCACVVAFFFYDSRKDSW